MKLLHRLAVLSLLLSLSLGIAGCEVSKSDSKSILVTTETAKKLTRISAFLDAADSEITFSCEGAFLPRYSSCAIDVNPKQHTKERLTLRAVTNPDGSITYLITDGSFEFKRALYEALGEITTTQDFKYDAASDIVNERKIYFDDSMKIRCTQSKDAKPDHLCWVLIAGSVVQ